MHNGVQVDGDQDVAECHPAEETDNASDIVEIFSLNREADGIFFRGADFYESPGILHVYVFKLLSVPDVMQALLMSFINNSSSFLIRLSPQATNLCMEPLVVILWYWRETDGHEAQFASGAFVLASIYKSTKTTVREF